MSKTLAWGFAMAPHRLRALVLIYKVDGSVLVTFIQNIINTIFTFFSDINCISNSLGFAKITLFVYK